MFLFTPRACRTLQKISLGKLRRAVCLSSYRLMMVKLPSDILKGIEIICFSFQLWIVLHFHEYKLWEIDFLSIKKETVVAAQRSQGKTWERASQQGVCISTCLRTWTSELSPSTNTALSPTLKQTNKSHCYKGTAVKGDFLVLCLCN